MGNLFDTLNATKDQLDFERKTHNLKTFTSLSQIGITAGRETIEEIVQKLPRHSILTYKKYNGSGNAAMYPGGSGKLTVQKQGDLNGIYFEFENEYYKWMANYNIYYGEDAFTGWVEVSKGAYGDFTGNLNTTTTPFVYATRSASNLPEEGSFYVVTLCSQNHKDTHRKQFAYRSSTGAYASYAYHREMADGVWSDWRLQIPTYGGSGSPEGRIEAPKGSLYIDVNGSTGSVLYVKEGGGAGNTGWAAK